MKWIIPVKMSFGRLRVFQHFVGRMAAASAALCGTVVFVHTALLKIFYPYQVNLGESAVSQAARLLAEGKVPYHDLTQPPFSLMPYGPVYLSLVALLRRVFQGPYMAGRVITFASTLGIAAVIFVFLKGRRAGTVAAATAALVCICNPYIRLWGTVVNVDMTGVLFSTLSFYFFSRCTEDDLKCRSSLYLGVIFSIIAFFTKSSMMACPLAFFFYALHKKKYAEATRFFLLEGSLLIAAYVGLCLWTDGGYYFHTTREIAQRQFFPVLIFRFWQGAVMTVPLLVLVSAYGFYGLAKNKKKYFQAFYLALVIVLTMSLGKQGSDTNYFLEWCVVSSLVLGGALRDAWEARAGKGGSWPLTALCLLIILQCVAWVYPDRHLVRTTESYRKARQFFDRISLFVNRTKGTILSQDMSLLLVNGREIFYEPFPMGQMSYSGVWDQTRILRELDQKSMSLAILNFYAPALRGDRNFTPAFMKKFNENYRFVGRAQPPAEISEITTVTLFFYVPK